MINKIKELLKQGKVVQLECIDTDGFVNSENKREYKETILDNKPLIVCYFNYRDDIVLLNQETIILKDELKYFKIKDDEPTFNDLLDKALQAFKDGVIIDLFIEKDFIEFNTSDYCDSFKVYKPNKDEYIDYIKTGIELIESLYKEDIIIESIEDLDKINWDTDTLILHNDCILNADHVKSLDKQVQFRLLKGSTVY